MKFNIPDMACGGCSNSIREALATIDPRATVQVDLAAKTVDVGSALNEAQIAAAIEAAGFHPAIDAH